MQVSQRFPRATLTCCQTLNSFLAVRPSDTRGALGNLHRPQRSALQPPLFCPVLISASVDSPRSETNKRANKSGIGYSFRQSDLSSSNLGQLGQLNKVGGFAGQRRRYNLRMQAGAMGEPTGASDSKGDIAQDLVDYLNASWTSFHATAVSKEMLLKAGFEQVRTGAIVRVLV